MKPAHTDLRDTRLNKALANAPDAHDVPPASTRLAIRTFAEAAVSQSRKASNNPATPVISSAPWWRRMWVSSGRAANPWNAAFATLLLSCIVTLTWLGNEVPDATVEETRSNRSKESAGSEATPVEPLPAVPAPAVASVDPQPAVTNKPKSEGLTPKTAQTTRPAVVDENRTQLETSAPEASVAMSPPVAEPAPLPVAKAMPTLPPPPPQMSRPAPAPPPVPAPLPAPAPAPAITMPSGAAGSASVAGRSGVMADRANSTAKLSTHPAAALAVLDDWVWVDVTFQGRTARLSKADGQELVNRVRALVASGEPSGAAGAQGLLQLRLRLLDQSDAGAIGANSTSPPAATTFELWDNRFRWQRAGAVEVTGMPRSGLVTDVLAAAARAMPP